MSTQEFYTDFSEGTPEQNANANMAASKDLDNSKQFLLKEITRSNGSYAVVKQNQDAIYMDKADASVKAETEKMVMSCISNASFICDNENRLELNDDGIKKEISEATKERFHTVFTVTTSNDKIFILY